MRDLSSKENFQGFHTFNTGNDIFWYNDCQGG